jgi:hypothetical protein
MANYDRDKSGARLNFSGIDLVHPVDAIPNGKVPFAQNVRAYLKGAVKGRNLLAGALYTLASAVHTIKRLNDSTPNGPANGYTLINGAGTVLSAWNSTLGVKNVATGLSGNPLSLIPFRPNASVQVYCFVGDNAPAGSVTISTKYLISGSATTFVTSGMLKVRSDGIIYRMGVKEPQLAPVVSTQNTTVVTTGNLLATDIPWTNYGGANNGYNYGETNGYPDPTPDGTAPFSINVLNATTVTINSLTGSATINGGTKSPTSLGPSTGVSTNPGHYVMVSGSGTTPPASATVVIGAFTDGSGNVIPAGVAPLYVPAVVDVGGATGPIKVPSGAVSFQIGINSTGNTFSSNSGSFPITVSVTTDALSPVIGIIGNLTLYYWQDSPTAGAVSAYIWCNPDDPGGGTSRTTSNAIGSYSGNSFIFDATFTAGIPGLPGIGNGSTPMVWSQLNPNESVSGTISVSPTQTSNFNYCLFGQVYIPAPGLYTFVLTNKDECIWGMEGATLVSAVESGSGEGGGVSISGSGQTITVVKGYPLLPRETWTNGDDNRYAQTTVVLSYAAAGIYGIEIDGDYWYRLGRILLLMASPSPGGPPGIIPTGAANQRQQVQYRYVYRSSATGATSNPSPESAAITLPVTANTITSLWSDDPQIDVVDYYRLDSVTAEFTYVNTGPNDNLGGGGTNTPVTDSLTDTQLGTQLLSYDNFEPFPSIDLPQKGVCSVSGGVITWVSGGAIGGTATGFNVRWLAGTEILIGSPTSLAYTFIARPTSTTSVTIPGVPDGTNLAYEIPEPILAAQPLPYMWGPTDNINYVYAVGDFLRPGTLYWCEGNNLDSAPDTNSQEVTDPGEPLVNGAIAGGLGVLFSIKRAWLIIPNFFNATATATGTNGSTWSLQESSITRGLFMPRCLWVSGGGLIFFRVNDGIHVSEHGASSESITDQDLYPLFPHESSGIGSSAPTAITIAGYTVYPPDDTLPQLQRFSGDNDFMYYDYQGIDGLSHTLVYDFQAKGWVVDSYTPAVTIHASDEGLSIQGTLAGCLDGSVRLLNSSGTESATAVMLTPSFDAGDTRTTKKWGDLYIESTTP